jgi:catechol 2,3-dioxygenase-like lactoylglutathione lyase family enzyme
MSQGVEVVGLYVRDQDEALAFYVEKLGFRVHTDVRNGDYRWLTVQHPDQPSFQLGLFTPGPPVLDAATAQTVRAIVAKGAMPPLVLVVDDCRAACDRMRARGVEVTLGLEQVGSADPPLAVHRVYGDRHRQLRRPGAGGWDASALGDLLAAAPARLAPAHRSVPVRAAVCHQVAQRAGRKATQGEAGSMKKSRHLPDTIVQWTRLSPAGILPRYMQRPVASDSRRRTTIHREGSHSRQA